MRPADCLPPAGRRFDSPYEPDSRYGNKRSQTWHGYKVHVSDPREPGQVHLITQVRTTPAHVQAIEMTDAIGAELARKSLLPGRHFVDAGYVEAELLVSRQRDYGIELIGPVRPDPSWQANQPEAYDASQFSIDRETRTVTCPQGQSNTSWTPGSDPGNNPVITVNFGKKTCRECPTREHCTRSPKYPRSKTIAPARPTRGFAESSPTSSHRRMAKRISDPSGH